jgi:hypothetical protein
MAVLENFTLIFDASTHLSIKKNDGSVCRNLIEQLRNMMQREVNLNSSVRMILYFIFWRDEERKNIHGIENFWEEF